MGLVLPQCTVNLSSFRSRFFSFMGKPGLASFSFFQPVFHMFYFLFMQRMQLSSVELMASVAKKKIPAMIFIVYLSTFYFIIFILGPFKKIALKLQQLFFVYI